MRWPPLDTDRNRFLFRLQAVLYVLVAAYFLAFALASRGLLPWLIFAAFLAASVVVGAGLLLMRAGRAQADARPRPRVSEAALSPETPAPGSGEPSSS